MSLLFSGLRFDCPENTMPAILKRFTILLLFTLAACGGDDDEWNQRLFIDASPSVLVAGDSVRLIWSSRNVSLCTAEGAWSGARTPAGTETIRLSGQGIQSFRLVCSDGVRTVVSTVDVAIAPG